MTTITRQDKPLAIMTECTLAMIMFALGMNQPQFVHLWTTWGWLLNWPLEVDGPGCCWSQQKQDPFKRGKVVDLFWFCILEAVRNRRKTDFDSRLRDTLVKLEDWLKEVDNKITLPGKFQTRIYHCGILPRNLKRYGAEHL